MSDELKLCPWCGRVPLVSSYDYRMPSGKVYGTQWKVECMSHDCPANPTVDWHYFTMAEAVAAWHRRADDV